MFAKYIYELKDYYLSGTHRNCNMVSAESTGVTFSNSENKNINYANAIKAIAENAPIFIHRDTKIVGSATYTEASQHIVPILNIGSVSHTTIDFRTVTEKGTDYLKNRIISCLTDNPSFSCKEHIASQSDKRAFWEAQLICIEALEIWHKRYAEKLREENREDILSYFENIPKKGAENFREAVQSLFFVFAFVRLCGNWPGIGRIDEILYPYYKKDLEAGKITYEEAREFLANMWVCGCEWAWGYDTDRFTAGSGDAQHYQNIVIGGCDRQGKDLTNDITYMVLDIAGELSISDYPISVRLSRNTPEKLHRKTAEVIKKGGGIVACYNEEVIIEALIKFGYTEEEARCFANDGCWEAIIPGKTNFIYTPFDTLQNLQDVLFSNINYTDFDSLYSDFEKSLEKTLYNHKIKVSAPNWDIPPTVLISLFVEGCTEKGLDYHEKGPVYTVHGIHAGGIATTADSLTALKETVFDRKELSYREYINIIKSNWENHTDLRIKSLDMPKYGNDGKGDEMAVRVFTSFTSINKKIKELNGILFPAGISTFGREIEWKEKRYATADGHLKGEILAGNMSPNPNSDREGPTALMKSYCKLNFTELPNIGPLDLKLHPSSLKGEAGTEAIISLNKSLVALKGCFLQINVIDRETLLDAQKHPERHQNLSVRVSGWNARFATLDREWQNMVIERTEHINI